MTLISIFFTLTFVRSTNSFPLEIMLTNITNISAKHLLQGTSDNIIVGSHVWVEDPAIAWIDGQVVKINGVDAEVHTTNGKMVNPLLVMCLYICLEYCNLSHMCACVYRSSFSFFLNQFIYCNLGAYWLVIKWNVLHYLLSYKLACMFDFCSCHSHF